MNFIRSFIKTETLADYRFLIPFFLLIQGIAFLATNLVLGRVLHLHQLLISKLQYTVPFSVDVLMKELFTFQIREYLWVYMIGIGLGIFVGVKTCYKLRSSFRNFADGQKGTSRFATTKEIMKQYKAVPEKTETYSGGGGVLIARTNYTPVQKKVLRKKDVLFIDDSPVNNLIIGTTRSGKGEVFVIPTIDIYSRATKQPSIIANDPKGELAAASFETLKKRGYHVEVLNLVNPLDSLSYNPLQLIIDAYKRGDYSEAQKLCNTLTYSLYMGKKESGDQFWSESAASLVNAIILAICDKCIAEGEEYKITLFEVAGMLSRLGSDNDVDEETGDEKNALDEYFKSLHPQSAAVLQYSTSNFAKGNTRGGIFSSAMVKLKLYTLDEIAKMTSKHSIDFERVGFGDKHIKGKTNPFAKIKVTFEDGTLQEGTANQIGNFRISIPSEEMVSPTRIIHIASTVPPKERVKEQRYWWDEEDQSNHQEETEQKETAQTSESLIQILSRDTDTQTCRFVYKKKTAMTIQEVVFFDKPIAIFMVVPDYDHANHVIASIFIRQMYGVLAKKATFSGGKCTREVVFMLDEAGNMPAIEGFAGIITVCLGRNIRFNLIYQEYAQIKKYYGDDEATIRGNCGNQIYLLSNDQDTKEKFSKMLGEKTQVIYSRSGEHLSTKKSRTESIESRRLLLPDELNLKEEEMVVIRVIKRRDLNGKKIKPYPIFNSGKKVLKFRYQYLAEEFDTTKPLQDVPITSLHKDVDLMSLVINFSRNPSTYAEESNESSSISSNSTQSAAAYEEESSDMRTDKLINEDSNVSIEDALTAAYIHEIELAVRESLSFIEEDRRNEYVAVYKKIKRMDDLKEFLEQEDLKGAFEKVSYLFATNESFPM